MADLVTLDQVRAALNLDDADTSNDDELQLYITAATAHAERRYGTIDDAPPDLELAALEDIRGLYQPGQIGPPAAFGAFGVDSTDTGVTYRPVRMWPRIDAWIDSSVGFRSTRGPSFAFPDARAWPDPVEWP